MTNRKPRGDIADRRVMEMIPGRLWAVHDPGVQYHGGPRITFHYSEESARHHYETGLAR